MKIPKFKKQSTTTPILKLKPQKFIYIPLISRNDENITIHVKPGDYIYMGDIIGTTKGNFKIPIHSSVSGKLIKFEETTYLTNKNVKCAVIENDYKEKRKEKTVPLKNLSSFTKQDFIERIKECGIVGLGGGAFPTYVKYDTKEKIENLIINGVECEPYITADYMTSKEYLEEILEATNAIMEINNINNCIIVVKIDDLELINHINNYIGTYPKIKLHLVKNKYPAGWERQIIKEVLNKEYKALPIEVNCIVNNISTIHKIYGALKYNMPLIERVVTITGPVVNNPVNVLVKIGTKIKTVIEDIGGLKECDEINYIAGGPMMGKTITSEELVVSACLSSIVVTPSLEETITDCLRCGKCIEKCPAGLSPVLIKDSIRNQKQLKKLNPERCIECGLCSYVCPSKIAIRDIVILAKNKIKETNNDTKK